MPVATPPIDRVFKALSDPTRLAVLERLSRGPAAATELARPFDMALPSFTQHLKVLEDTGLVHSQKRGRVRTYELETERLQEAEGWLSKRRRLWERRLDQLDDLLMELKERK